MRKLLPLIAALGAAFAVNSAQAIQLLVDDFNTPNATVSGGDVTASGAGTGGSIANALANGVQTANHALVGQIATNRRVFSNLIENPLPGQLTTVSVGGGATGNLDIANGSGTVGEALIVWSTTAFVLPAGDANLLFNVLFSNLGTPTADTQLDFEFKNAGNVVQWTKNVDLGAIGFVPGGSGASFNLTGADALALSLGGTLSMLISGPASFDLTLDQFSISIPEPTSLALVGLALVGAGVAARRRKA